MHLNLLKIRAKIRNNSNKCTNMQQKEHRLNNDKKLNG